MQIVKACAYDLVRFIIVQEIFPVLEYWFEDMTITFAVDAVWIYQEAPLLLDLEIQIILAREKTVETVIVLEKCLEYISLLIKEEKP